VGANLFHADRRHDKANSRLSQFCETRLITGPAGNRTKLLHPVTAVTIPSYPGMYIKCHKASFLTGARGRRLRR